MSKIFIILFNASKQHWTLYVWHTACFSNQFMTSFPSFCSFLCLLSDKLVTRRLWSAVYWKQIARSQNLSLSSLSLRVHKSHVFYCLTVTAQHHKGKQEKKKMKCKVFCIGVYRVLFTVVRNLWWASFISSAQGRRGALTIYKLT